MKTKDFFIPILLSEYVKTMEDWEIVEWVSRFEATSKYYRNGATYAKYKELINLWSKRYPGEEVPIMQCVPPLDSELHMLSEYNNTKINKEKGTEDEW